MERYTCTATTSKNGDICDCVVLYYSHSETKRTRMVIIMTTVIIIVPPVSMASLKDRSNSALFARRHRAMAVFKLTQFSNGRRRQTHAFLNGTVYAYNLHVLCVRWRYCGRPGAVVCDRLCFADLTCALCTVSLTRAKLNKNVRAGFDFKRKSLSKC